MTDPMSPEELRACRDRAEAATPGALSVAREDEEHGAITYAVVRGGLTLAFVPEDTRGKWEKSSAKADAAFWASARADVLRLLATIAALQETVGMLHAADRGAAAAIAAGVARAESAELGCEIAYRREPTQAEGDAHEYRHEQSMGPAHGSGECFVPMGGWTGRRCRTCSRWVWGGPTACVACAATFVPARQQAIARRSSR